MATSKNIYEAHFWEKNTDESPKALLISFLCPPRVTDTGKAACEAEICFPVINYWQSVLNFPFLYYKLFMELLRFCVPSS